MKKQITIIISVIIIILAVFLLFKGFNNKNTENQDTENQDLVVSERAPRDESDGGRGEGGPSGPSELPNAELLSQMISETQDKFIQLEYTNPETSITLLYNLYIPENYDENKEYPLVTFIHDSSVVSDDVTRTLTQGFGAIIWATDEEQAKHESFVLAPQFQTQIANDDFELTEEGYELINLINSLLDEYSIDENRLYITGQSMGCMTSMALNIAYPDLFAASLYVAGQWDPNQMSVLANDNIFYIVSEGDIKASPGMDSFIEVLNAENTSYSFATWNGQWSESEFNTAVEEILSENNHINLVKFEPGTVTLNGNTSPAMEHMCTWSVAYLIDGVRDWLFEQSK